MGGSTSSTPMGSGSALASQFGQNPGYQQQPIAPISAPTLQTPILPTPEQAAAATQASILARNPMPAPRAAPRNSPFEAYNQQVRQQNLGLTGRGNR